jgi:DNA mismatch endonuclease (patch repair protein)
LEAALPMQLAGNASGRHPCNRSSVSQVFSQQHSCPRARSTPTKSREHAKAFGVAKCFAAPIRFLWNIQDSGYNHTSPYAPEKNWRVVHFVAMLNNYGSRHAYQAEKAYAPQGLRFFNPVCPMSDVLTRAKRSQVMAAVRSKGNKTTELKLAALLRSHGINGWRRHQPLPGKPDFAFRRQRLAVFVDGCFWHGCRWHCRMPAGNKPYWSHKIGRNQTRDRQTTKELAQTGWRVLRHALKKFCISVDAGIRKVLRMPPRDATSFETVEWEVIEFEQILKGFGIEIKNGTPLENMCLSLLDLVRRHRQPETINPYEDLRIAYRPALGLHDIVKRIVRLHQRRDFEVFEQHLRLLNSGTVAQNISAPTDKVAAKIFELLIGLICLEIGKNVDLDSPVQSYGDNPDVLVDLCDRRWGFACKVLSGTSPITMFDRLEEGIAQIENSPAEVGCVILNLKNQLPHDTTWPLLNQDDYDAGIDTPTSGAWKTIDQPLRILLEIAEQRKAAFVKANGAQAVQNLFLGKKSIAGALLFLQTATAVVTPNGSPGNHMRGVFVIMNAGIRSQDEAVLNKLNDAMHHQ